MRDKVYILRNNLGDKTGVREPMVMTASSSKRVEIFTNFFHNEKFKVYIGPRYIRPSYLIKMSLQATNVEILDLRV